MIKLQNVTKKYGNTVAVDNLSFTVQKGEIVGFLGPNGAGKTTTMRLIAGYLSPDAGTIEILGKDIIKDEITARQHIGYLPENNPLYPNMLVADLLSFSADLKGIKKDKRKQAFDFVVSACGIGDKWYQPIAELSKGYRQRVGLAIALLGKPEVIMLDEPTEGLDPNQRADIRALIKELAQDHTVLMSTHVMQEAMAVCNRLLIINQGKLLADGSPEELMKKSEKKRLFNLAISGQGISAELKKIPEVQEVTSLSRQGEKEIYELAVDKNIEIAPSLSKLIQDKNWIIWELTEKKQGLEDIFHTLTQEKINETLK